MKKKFFLQLILFGLLFIPLNHLVTRSYIRYTRQPFVYESSRRTFEQVQDEISLLVSGDSHPLSDFDDTLVPGAYNFATKGEGIMLNYYKLRYYLLKKDFQPEVVVLPIDLNAFSSYRTSRFSNQDPAFWAQYVDFIEFGREQGRLRFFALKRVQAEFAYLGGVEEVLDVLLSPEPWEVDEMTMGFLPSYGDFSALSVEDQTKVATGRTADHFGGSNPYDPLLAAYFNRLLDLLADEQVQVVLVWYPTTEAYYQQAGSYFPVDEHFAEVQSLLGDRDNVLWLDYHTLFYDQLEYFRDSDHLNVEGAQVFTEQLIQDLEANGITW